VKLEHVEGNTAAGHELDERQQELLRKALTWLQQPRQSIAE
jgi:hypothetical protein